jgi:hypothetical protein
MIQTRKLVAYRHAHEQTNTAVVLMAALSEFGLVSFDPDKPREELVLHGLIQRGLYLEDRGVLLRNALRYLFDHGVQPEVLQDTKRTAALQEYVRKAKPDYDLQFTADLGRCSARGLSPADDFRAETLVLLIEARHAIGRLPLHILLARAEGGSFVVMNSETGENYSYSGQQLCNHLNAPPGFGAMSFAGRQYLYTGVAARLNGSPALRERSSQAAEF